MKRNILFSMRALVLAALVPLAGCLVEESVEEEEDVDDSAEEIGAHDDVTVEGDGVEIVGLPGESDMPTAVGFVLPGQEEQDPSPLPWTGSEAHGGDEENRPNPPPVEAASKSTDSVHDPY